MITREWAKELLNKAFNEINCNCTDKGLCGHQSNPFALEVTIDEIFDQFEAPKLCNNCAFDYCGCSVQDSILQADPTATFDTFGCNGYELKVVK